MILIITQSENVAIQQLLYRRVCALTQFNNVVVKSNGTHHKCELNATPQKSLIIEQWDWEDAVEYQESDKKTVG